MVIHNHHTKFFFRFISILNILSFRLLTIFFATFLVFNFSYAQSDILDHSEHRVESNTYLTKQYYQQLMKILEQSENSFWSIGSLITTISQDPSINWEKEFTNDQWLTLCSTLLALGKEYFLSALIHLAPTDFINKQDSQGNTLLHYVTREAVIRSLGSQHIVAHDLSFLFLLVLERVSFSHLITSNHKDETALHIAFLNETPIVITAFANAYKKRVQLLTPEQQIQEAAALQKVGFYTEKKTFLPVFVYYYLLHNEAMLKALLDSALFDSKVFAYCCAYTKEKHLCQDQKYCNKTVLDFALQVDDTNFINYLLTYRAEIIAPLSEQQKKLINQLRATIKKQTASFTVPVFHVTPGVFYSSEKSDNDSAGQQVAPL